MFKWQIVHKNLNKTPKHKIVDFMVDAMVDVMVAAMVNKAVDTLCGTY